MKLDLTPILNRRVPVIDFDFTVDASSVPDAPDISEEITLDGDIRVFGKVLDNDGYMSLKACVSVDYTTVCDRCLAPLSESGRKSTLLRIPREVVSSLILHVESCFGS